MKVTNVATEVAVQVSKSLSRGQPVRIRRGLLSWILRNAGQADCSWACIDQDTVWCLPGNRSVLSEAAEQ